MITSVELHDCVLSGVDAEKAVPDGLPIQAYRFQYQDHFEHVALINGEPLRICQGAFCGLHIEHRDGLRRGMSASDSVLKWATDRRFV